MKIKNKICIFSLVLFFSAAAATTAVPFFTGYTGVLASINPVKDSIKPNLTMQALFAGQLDFSGIFLLRTELSVKTQNIFTNGIFKDTDATFRIDEISATARFKGSDMSHFLTFFIGEYESIGSDLFLQRQFGIQPIGSPLTETWQGLSGTSIYPFSNIGFSYVMRMQSPKAAGIYLYTNNNDHEINVNADLRFAAVYKYATFDIAAGVSFPIETQTAAGEKVFLLIRTMDLHGGLSMLLGNKQTISVFLQGGIKKIRLRPAENEKVLNLEDLYFIIEPRFAAENFHLNFTLFNVPAANVKELLYISNPIGCNLSAYVDNIQIGSSNLATGLHLTFSAANTLLTDIGHLSTHDLSMQISPFLSAQIFGGTFNVAAKLDVLKIATWYDSFKFTMGYKILL